MWWADLTSALRHEQLWVSHGSYVHEMTQTLTRSSEVISGIVRDL
jgi:hypothetical protein